MTGLHFNTPDVPVKEYLEALVAKVAKVEAIYGVHREGPWKGQYNGDRRFMAEFTIPRSCPWVPTTSLMGLK